MRNIIFKCANNYNIQKQKEKALVCGDKEEERENERESKRYREPLSGVERYVQLHYYVPYGLHGSNVSTSNWTPT